MVKVASKKQKTTKKPDTTTTTKKKITKPPKKKPPTTQPSSDSDSDSDSPSPDQIHKLIEPYTKDQLIEFIINAAISNPNLYTQIRNTADADVSHRKIFVYGLGWDTTKEALTQTFKPYGEIEDCNVVIDRVTNKAKGFGFVQFKTRKGAVKALKEPRKRINNRTASCQLACLGPPGSGSGSGSGGMDNSSRKIYVSNVQPDIEAERLRSFFERFGEIETGPLGFDSLTGKSRGFALFVYKTVEGFRKALEEPYKVFEGHQLHCQKAASDGKNKSVLKGSGSGITNSVVQQPNTQMMAAAAVASTQNLALLNQAQLGLGYGGFLAANPFYASGVLGQAGGLGGYYAGASATPGLNVGVGNASLLGGYSGGVSPGLPGVGLQNAYPKKKGGASTPPALGSASGSKSQGAGGSFSGYRL